MLENNLEQASSYFLLNKWEQTQARTRRRLIMRDKREAKKGSKCASKQKIVSKGN